MADPLITSLKQAWAHTKLICFSPFNAEKWFALGFVAWLVNFGLGGFPGCWGGGGGNNWGNSIKHSAENPPQIDGGSGPATTPTFQGDHFQSAPDSDPAQFFIWIETHLIPIILIGFVVLLVAAVVGTVVLWVRSRAQVMFVENVVWQRDAIVEPWKRLAPLGNSLFWFEVYVMTAALAAFAIALGIGALIALPDIRSHQFGNSGMIAAVLLSSVTLLCVPAVGLALYVQRHFVLPIMYRTGQLAIPAWGIFWREFGRNNIFAFVLFLILEWIVGILVGLTLLIAGCLTCCIGFLLVMIPYIGTVALLPMFVFYRAWPIFFLEQLRPDWEFFPRPQATAPPSSTPPPSSEPIL